MGFFKAYDLRGTFGTDFDLATVYGVGRALPQVVKGKRWLVGRDCCVTSQDVRDALVKGLTEAGAAVTDLGLCTTPMVYFFTAEDGYDGSVMITASHNPPSDNGLKVSMRGALPVGYANGLDEVEKIVARDSCHVFRERGRLTADGAASCAEAGPEILARYVAWLKAHASSTFNLQSSSLRYAVDCSNGMASLLAHELFPDAVIINDTLDGTFPNHSPNPLTDESRRQIAALVRKRGLDCGVIFDGDADRCMFVDENGEFVQPDYLIPIVARATLCQVKVEGQGQERNCQIPLSTEELAKPCRRGSVPRQNEDIHRISLTRQAAASTVAGGFASSSTSASGLQPKVIHDVRTSRGAIEALKRMGCEPVMVPVGHAFAKPLLRESGAICGGELAGHYYFSEFHFCDSGALAALRVLCEIAAAKARGESFSAMMRPISGVYANSGELNFKVDDKDAAIERVLAAAKEKLPTDLSRSTMDGIRLEYAEGWVSIRKSNTEPFLRLLAECDTKERLAEWIRLLRSAIGSNDEG